MPDSRHAPATAPVALTIAGFDTSAGAGLQADLLTFHNHGYQVVTATTSLVVETPLEVRHCQATPDDLLKEQVELLLATYHPAVIKIGLIATPGQVHLLSEILADQFIPIVLDPVGISSTGQELQKAGTLPELRKYLAPLATVITPNFPEVQLLADDHEEPDPEKLASRLSKELGTAVFLTGGHHGQGEEICDLLVEEGQATSFCGTRLTTPASLHGTGCVLSSALAAGLGAGKSLSEAIPTARTYLREAMATHLTFPHATPLLALNHFRPGR